MLDPVVAARVHTCPLLCRLYHGTLLGVCVNNFLFGISRFFLSKCSHNKLSPYYDFTSRTKAILCHLSGDDTSPFHTAYAPAIGCDRATFTFILREVKTKRNSYESQSRKSTEHRLHNNNAPLHFPPKDDVLDSASTQLGQANDAQKGDPGGAEDTPGA